MNLLLYEHSKMDTDSSIIPSKGSKLSASDDSGTPGVSHLVVQLQQ